MAWQPTDASIPSATLKSAEIDSREGRYEDALAKFLWFHEASRAEIGMGGVRLSFALSSWMGLATRYRPALVEFIQLRDALESRCRANGGDFDSFHDVAALNRCLDDDRRTINLFLEIAKAAPDSAATLYHVVEECLVVEGMYRECAPFLEWKHRLNAKISGYQRSLEFEEATHLPTSPLRGFARDQFQKDMTRLIALLAVNDRGAEAKIVRDRCLLVLDDAPLRAALDDAVLGYFPKPYRF